MKKQNDFHGKVFKFTGRKKGRVYYSLPLSRAEYKKALNEQIQNEEGAYTRIFLDKKRKLLIVSFPVVLGGITFTEKIIRKKILNLIKLILN